MQQLSCRFMKILTYIQSKIWVELNSLTGQQSFLKNLLRLNPTFSTFSWNFFFTAWPVASKATTLSSLMDDKTARRHLYGRLQEGRQSQMRPRRVTHVDVSTHSQRRPPPRQCQLLISNPGHDKQVNFHSHTALAASTTNNTFAQCCLAVRPAAEITCSHWTVFFVLFFFFAQGTRFRRLGYRVRVIYFSCKWFDPAGNFFCVHLHSR